MVERTRGVIETFWAERSSDMEVSRSVATKVAR